MISFCVLNRMSVVASLGCCLRWRPSTWMLLLIAVICVLMLLMLNETGTLLMHSQGRWSLISCGKCIGFLVFFYFRLLLVYLG